jgi:hypothetical protein
MPDRFEAPTAWSAERPETLVVCCSDGRWHAQVVEFVRALVSERPDFYAVPGGAVSLDLWSSSLEEAWAAERSFRFLAHHHELASVWLIAHEACAFYRSRYAYLSDSELKARQVEDLVRAEANLRRWMPGIEVHQVYARVEEGRVVFDIGAPSPLDRDAAGIVTGPTTER